MTEQKKMKLYILFLAKINVSQGQAVTYGSTGNDICPARVQSCSGLIIPHCSIILFLMDSYGPCVIVSR